MRETAGQVFRVSDDSASRRAAGQHAASGVLRAFGPQTPLRSNFRNSVLLTVATPGRQFDSLLGKIAFTPVEQGSETAQWGKRQAYGTFAHAGVKHHALADGPRWPKALPAAGDRRPGEGLRLPRNI